MTKTISQLQKEAVATPQYLLKVEGINLWLSNRQNLSGVNLVPNKKGAMKFSVEFDNPEMKAGIWNAAASIQFNNKDVKFEVVKL